MGGEFAYECKGFLNDDPATNIKVYAIRLNVYRDCLGDGAFFDGANPAQVGPFTGVSAAGHITIFRNGEVFVPTLRIRLQSFSLVEVDDGNPCFESNEPICQQIGVYQFDVELPVADSTYVLAYQRCCRNGNIVNMIDPTELGSTYSIDITPEAQRFCNQSPLFNSDPPIGICVNEEFRIDLGATEREGDSLVYRFCSPTSGGSREDPAPDVESPPPFRTILFRAPQFDLENQLGIGSELDIDPFTGLLFGRPAFRGNFSLSVCVEEWSRGPVAVLLSTSKRELQLNVTLCENKVSAGLLGIEPGADGLFLVRQCGPEGITIRNSSTDEAFIDTYDWLLEGPLGLVTSNERDFTPEISTFGEYAGQMILNRQSFSESCRDTLSFSFQVRPGIEADFTFVEPGCDDEPVFFTDGTMPRADNVVENWKWRVAPLIAPLTDQNPAYHYQTPGNYRVFLEATDEYGCSDTISKTLEYFPSPRTILVEPDAGLGCAPYTKNFVNLSRPVDATYRYEWDFGDGGIDSVANPTHLFAEAGTYDVYLGITSPTDCFVDTVFSELIVVREPPVAGFNWLPEVPTNLQRDLRVFNTSPETTQQRFTVSNLQGEPLAFRPGDFDYTLRDTARVLITQFITGANGCRDTLTQTLQLRSVNTFFMPDAFTPNGDGLNDVLSPVGVFSGVTDYSFTVWSRWGQRMFSSDDPRVGWDGSVAGKDTPDGAYLWQATYTDVEGKFEQFKGGVMLVR